MSFDAHPRSSLIVALDFDSLSSALKFAKQIADLVGMFKIGNQLFTAAGPASGARGGGAGSRRVPRSEISRHSEHRGRSGAVLRRHDRRAAGQYACARRAAMMQRRRRRSARAGHGRRPAAPAGGDHPNQHGPEGHARSRDRRAAQDRVVKLARLAKEGWSRWRGGFGARKRAPSAKRAAAIF